MITTPARLLYAQGLVFVLASASMLQAAAVEYADRADFEETLGSVVIDDYSHPDYVFVQNDAIMSAVLGETDYTATGFSNVNIVLNEAYCAGCNGSFLLSFTTTSVGTPAGVYGVGVDIVENFDGYVATVLFADGSATDYAMPLSGSFWGVTADQLIEAIHFGGSNGGTRTDGYFQIDNLTIGNSATPPGTGRLVYLGLDPSDHAHALQAEARILAGNAARWAGRGTNPRIAFVEGAGGFTSEVGVRLAEAGLSDITEITSPALAGADLGEFDVLYLGPTTEVSDYLAAAANIRAFSEMGGGLVAEANVLDPASWTWVPLAGQIGHSGATNVGTEAVYIMEPSHPIMQGLSDDGLSNWGMSVHSTFSTPEAAGFDVLAVDQIQFGMATIIAREATVIFTDGFESGDTSSWSVVVR